MGSSSTDLKQELQKTSTASSGQTTHDGVQPPAHAPADAGEQAFADEDKPTGLPLYGILLGLYLCVFLVCLDISIIAPAIPPISNDFHDTSKVTWYYSIYLALNCSFQPVSGPLLRLNSKWTFLAFLVIFEIGSLVCAVAQGPDVFIFGRALAGVGSAGTYVGVMTIIAQIAPIDKQTAYTNGVGIVYSLGAVCGPLIGGAFTSHVSWRWCFWINLPIGGVSLIACIFLLRSPTKKAEPFKERLIVALKDTDFVGLALVIGALIMLLMVFQWGGLEYDWNSGVIIGLLVGFFVLVLIIVGWIWWKGDRAYLRPRLMKQRSIGAGMGVNFAIGGAYFTLISLLAFYFQIRGSSSLRSGVQLLPLIAGVVTGLTVGGGLVGKIGYVNPVLLVGLVIFTIGMGLITLLDESSSTPMWAGISVMCGIGSGLAFMLPFVLAQTVLAPVDLEAGSCCVLFVQTLGGAIIFGLGQSVYLNDYNKKIMDISGLPNPGAIVTGGITAFRNLAPPEFVDQIEVVAIDAMRRAFYAPIVCLGLATLFAFPWMEWNSVKPPTDDEGQAPKMAMA